jgi:hypothetical protein
MPTGPRRTSIIDSGFARALSALEDFVRESLARGMAMTVTDARAEGGGETRGGEVAGRQLLAMSSLKRIVSVNLHRG